MYTYEYPRPALTVDSAIFRIENNEYHILLIKRANQPFKNKWAFPGGFVDMDETIDKAAYRELEEETGITAVELVQFKTYGSVERDPRGRTVSVVYYSMLKDESQKAVAMDDACDAQWFNINKLPELAFDHEIILLEIKGKLK